MTQRNPLKTGCEDDIGLHCLKSAGCIAPNMYVASGNEEGRVFPARQTNHLDSSIYACLGGRTKETLWVARDGT